MAHAPAFPSVELAKEIAKGFSIGDKPLDAPKEVPPEIGALRQWRLEVTAGVRKKSDIDALSIAACHEAAARDELRWGMQGAARQSRLAAADTIVASIAENVA